MRLKLQTGIVVYPPTPLPSVAFHVRRAVYPGSVRQFYPVVALAAPTPVLVLEGGPIPNQASGAAGRVAIQAANMVLALGHLLHAEFVFSLA